MAQSKRLAPRFQREIRRAEISTLLVGGLSYDEIVATVKKAHPDWRISKGTVHNDVSYLLEGFRERMQANIDEAKAIDLQRVEEMIGAVWPAARRGNLAAVDRASRLVDQKMRMLGYAAPQKHSVSGGDWEGAKPVRLETRTVRPEPDLSGLTTDDLETLLSKPLEDE